jgi:hypothetical protein
LGSERKGGGDDVFTVDGDLPGLDQLDELGELLHLELLVGLARDAVSRVSTQKGEGMRNR